MRTGGFFWGFILIIAGFFLLINNFLDLGLFRLKHIWPLFILIPGLAFEFAYFSTRRNPGLLVPGGILVTIGLLFFFESVTNWSVSAYTWPVYPLAVAIGLFQLYWFSDRQSGLLVPVFILTAVSCLGFGIMFLNSINQYIDLGIVFPVLLVLIGVFVLVRGSGKKPGSK